MPIMTMWAPTVRARASAVFAAELPGLDVDLHVELPELGLEVGVRDRVQHLGVAQRRVAPLVDQVQLDLQAGHRPLEVELRAGQHPLEHVQVPPDLLPVPGAVLPGELDPVDVLPHA
jgi:hypothetical protein